MKCVSTKQSDLGQKSFWRNKSSKLSNSSLKLDLAKHGSRLKVVDGLKNIVKRKNCANLLKATFSLP